MIWISIGLAGAAGALAGLIARLIIGKPREKSGAYTVVAAICFVILYSLCRQFILPELTARYDAERAEAIMLEISAYQAIKEYYPARYREILEEIRHALIRKDDRTEMIGRLRSRVSTLILKCLPKASDEAVVSYMSVMVREIKELSDQDPDLCFRFLFPQEYSTIRVRKYLSEETQRADLEALSEVIRTSAENPQGVPEENEIWEDLEKILLDLHKVYGDDVLLLDNPSDPRLDKRKVCTITADLYRMILKLPLKQSSKILRFMLSET